MRVLPGSACDPAGLFSWQESVTGSWPACSSLPGGCQSTALRTTLLELISPAGFETYFAAMAEPFSSGPREPARAAAIQQHYHLDMDFSSIARLSAAYGLRV